jgi:hypothetical protein
MTTKPPALTPTASPTKIDLFLDRLAARNAPSGRLIFGLDATASREQLWSRAIELQSGMFNEVAGGLEIQLVYYRGTECRSSQWMTNAQALEQSMRKIQCVGGYTQIKKVLEHARRAHDQTPISTLVFVGDAMEEPIDSLCASANELGSRGVRALMFPRGRRRRGRGGVSCHRQDNAWRLRALFDHVGKGAWRPAACCSRLCRRRTEGARER